jgi:hypothetical protein
MKTISVEELKKRIKKADRRKFYCCRFNRFKSINCFNCIFWSDETACGVLEYNYDFKAIFSHDFSPKTEITIDDLKPFKI